jgi:putative transcriptional regulator
MPSHHPPQDLLAAYASGGVEAGEGLFAATHLALCPTCRAVCDGFEAVGGSMLERTPELALGAGALARVFARIDASPGPVPSPPPPDPVGPNDAPLPLRSLTGSLDAVRFRRVAPGILRFDLPGSTAARPMALLSLRPGLHVPAHTHGAVERGLVLRGGFTDEVGHFVRGDVSWRDAGEAEPHRQRMDEGERCVVLMVDDGPKIPVDWMGRVVNTLFGL